MDHSLRGNEVRLMGASQKVLKPQNRCGDLHNSEHFYVGYLSEMEVFRVSAIALLH